MSSKFRWPDVTLVIDTTRVRIRYYKRKNPTSPGKQMRQKMAKQGKRWCRKCVSWLPLDSVSNRGVCKQHEREEYRAYYAKNPDPIRRRVHARKRGVAPVPPDADLVAELFGHMCAYCGGPGETWDHIIPVRLGGETIPGNIVPACNSCNSSKGARPLSEWLGRGGRITAMMVEYMLTMHQGI